MMRDPYQILGVAKSAGADEIKGAYRKLAKKLHPDVNPGKKDIEQKFKDVTAAYDLLSDAGKRKRFDRGEIDAEGNERGFAGAGAEHPFGGGQWRGQNYRGGDPFSQFGNVEDILSQFMGGSRGRGPDMGGSGMGSGMRGGDVTYSLAIPFAEACLGGKSRVTLTSGKTIDVTIPPGTNEGHKLRLRGQGLAGIRGKPGGDAIIEIHVEPHPFFTRKDNDIHLDAPVGLHEALLGAGIKVPTLDGDVTVKVPKGANTGTVLRLKGKGVPFGKNQRGDMFVKLAIMLPDPPPADLAEAIEKWGKKNPYNPRSKLGWG
ncbi:MAG TPA: J domain-containing protein [Alphaproteobacteria bacterium]|nr:J domain-containing protein [Alphaproteobacteria bacterium]